MMPRKKRITLIAVISVIILVVLVAAFLIVYINTDVFKSKKTLFERYIVGSIDYIDNINEILEKSEYDKTLDENKCTTNTQIKTSYTGEIGTSSENTDNDINKLGISIDGQTDKQNNYDHKDIQLLNNDEKAFEIEYLKNDNTYGIKFSDLFEQYISVENSNLKELFKKFGYSDEEIEKIPDEVKFDKGIKESLVLNEEEKQNEKEKYSKIISDNIANENITKNSNVKITVNNKQVDTNTYTLSLTKEQMNNMFVKILENLKQDEIILAKLDDVDTTLESYGISGIINKNIKEEFINKIEAKIEEINRNNIGSEETKIVVYENQKKTVRIMIQGTDYEINLDSLKTQEENYIEININENENTQVYKLKKSSNELSFNVEEDNQDKTKTFNIIRSEKNNSEKNIVVKFEDESNKVETDIDQKLNVVDNFENEIKLENEKNIKLNNLNDENFKKIISTINTALTEKTNQLYEQINKDDLRKPFEAMGIIQKEQNIEANGMSQTEKNRFNSKFEFAKGEELQSEDVLKIIEASKSYINGLEVTANKEIRLKLDINSNDDQAVEKIKNFIEKKKDAKYNVDIEYDETSGLASYIVITIPNDSE